MKIQSEIEIDRFHLEQEIMNCWHVVDDIKTLTKRFMDGSTPMTEDEVSNVLIGLEHLYQMKFEQCYETFELCCKNDVFEKTNSTYVAHHSV